MALVGLRQILYHFRAVFIGGLITFVACMLLFLPATVCHFLAQVVLVLV